MEKIEGGAFQVARKIFESELWLKKPAIWKVIWIYILGKVNHEPYKGLGEGEGFFNFSEEIRDIGIDCTPDKIKKFLRYARESSMIRTERSTRGMIVKVLNYKDYQDLTNYRGTSKSTREAREKHERSTPINNNYNNYNNSLKENLIKEKKSEEEEYEKWVIENRKKAEEEMKKLMPDDEEEYFPM